MKNKKGFTLIELLAVIVILAIIALIATPIVMNVIENARKGAAERSAENYVRAVETAIMTNRTSGTKISDGVYAHGEIAGVETSGETPTAASIIVKDGQVMDGSTITMNGYVVNIIDGVGKVGDFGTVIDLFTTTQTEVSEFIKNQNASTPTLTYNPITGEKGCTQDNTSCFGWYVLEDKGAEYATVSLLMDRNLGETVAWCGDETRCKINGAWNHSVGPITALEALYSNTANWKVLTSLPSFEQIDGVNDETLTKWMKTNLKPFGPPPSDEEAKKEWLSKPYGYWISNIKNGPADACNIVGDGNTILAPMGIYTSSGYGIRPVITIPKLKLQNS